jgi:hypothetical protein
MLQLWDVTRKSTGSTPMLVEGSFRLFCIGLRKYWTIASQISVSGALLRAKVLYIPVLTLISWEYMERLGDGRLGR